jgi:hypothetical protein
MISFLHKHHRKIQEISTGIVIYEGFCYIYDLLFYPFALAYWGFVDGGMLAVGISFFINIVIFWFYEYMQVDWLGAHALRELENEENKSNIQKLLTWIGKKKEHTWEKIMNPVVFSALLLPIDPVIVAVHYQRQHFKGLVWRDWGLLLAATAIANAWWLIKIGAIVEAVKFLWNIIS